MPLSMMGFDITIFSMEVTGTFASDGSRLGGTSLFGAFDLAEIGPALGDSFGFDLSDPDIACGLISSFGIVCETCPHKDEAHCLTLHLTNIDAAATGTPVEPVDVEYCHEECAERDPETCDTEEDTDGA
jgi:hypothetical protein